MKIPVDNKNIALLFLVFIEKSYYKDGGGGGGGNIRRLKTHPCHLAAQSKAFLFLFSFVFSLTPLTHVFWQLIWQHFMTYDVTTVKGFPILSEADLKFLAQGQIFIFPSVQKSQNKLNLSQKTFWVLVFERILTLDKWFPLLRTSSSRPFLSLPPPFPALFSPALSPLFSQAILPPPVLPTTNVTRAVD